MKFIYGALLVFLLGCSGASPDPGSFPLTKRDQEVVAKAPKPEDLVFRPQSILLLTSSLEKGQKAAWRPVAEALFRANTPLRPIDERVLERVAGKAPLNLLQAIQIGQKLQADYLASFKEKKIGAKEVTLFQLIDLNQLETLLTAQLGNPLPNDSTLARELRTLFPLTGFIIETRGAGRFVKISLGRSLGVVVGKRFLIEGARAIRAPVIRVNENTAWLEVSDKDQQEIKKGLKIKSLSQRGWLD